MGLNSRFMVQSVDVLRKNAKVSVALILGTVGSITYKFGKFVGGIIIDWSSHTSGFVIINGSFDAEVDSLRTSRFVHGFIGQIIVQ